MPFINPVILPYYAFPLGIQLRLSEHQIQKFSYTFF